MFSQSTGVSFGDSRRKTHVACTSLSRCMRCGIKGSAQNPYSNGSAPVTRTQDVESFSGGRQRVKRTGIQTHPSGKLSPHPTRGVVVGARTQAARWIYRGTCQTHVAHRGSTGWAREPKSRPQVRSRIPTKTLADRWFLTEELPLDLTENRN